MAKHDVLVYLTSIILKEAGESNLKKKLYCRFGELNFLEEQNTTYTISIYNIDYI